VTVRQAKQSDARAIAAVHVRAWREAYRGLLPDELLDQLSVEQREQSWHELLRDGLAGAFTLVAVGSGARVEGFCAAATPSRDEDADERIAEIAATYVEPRRWRAGIGSLLMEAVLGELRQRGYREVTL